MQKERVWFAWTGKEKNLPKLTKFASEWKLEVNYNNGDGMRPLEKAVELNWLEGVEELLTCGSTPRGGNWKRLIESSTSKKMTSLLTRYVKTLPEPAAGEPEEVPVNELSYSEEAHPSG